MNKRITVILILIILIIVLIVNVSIRIVNYDIVSENSIKTINQTSLFGINLYYHERVWSIPEFMEIRGGEIFYTGMDEKIYKINNPITKSQKTYITEQTTGKITVIYSLPLLSGGTQIEQMILSVNGYEKIREITKAESCNVTKLSEIKNILLFCQDEENEIVYEIDSKKEELFKVLFNIPDRRNHFDSSSLYFDEGYIYILAKIKTNQACAFFTSSSQPKCYEYPKLNNDEILEYLNLEDKSMFKEFTDFYFKAVRIIDENKILVYGDAWRYGYGSYGVLDLTTQQVSKIMRNTTYNPMYMIGWETQDDDNMLRSKYMKYDDKLFRYVINLNTKRINEEIIFDARKIHFKDQNFFIANGDKFYAIIHNSEPYKISSICDDQPEVKFGSLLNSIVMIKDKTCNKLLIITEDSGKLKEKAIENFDWIRDISFEEVRYIFSD